MASIRAKSRVGATGWELWSFAVPSLPIPETKLGPEPPDLIWSLAGLAGSHRAAGDHRAAIAVLERALAIGSTSPADPVLLAGVKFALAQASWHVRRDRARALALARAARTAFEGVEGRDDARADVAAFIRGVSGESRPRATR